MVAYHFYFHMTSSLFYLLLFVLGYRICIQKFKYLPGIGKNVKYIQEVYCHSLCLQFSLRKTHKSQFLAKLSFRGIGRHTIAIKNQFLIKKNFL